MSYPRYPKYKKSGLPLLGDVPEHWVKTALKFLGNYQNGYPFKPEDWSDEGLPIIRISQLTGDAEPNRFSGELDKRVFVENGNLLFSWSATIDSFIWDGGSGWLNQHIFKVSPSAEADQGFLFYVIKHVAPKLADFDAHGSTMRHIKKESLGERVFVPPVSEQIIISKFLDRETAKIDALAKAFNGLIDLLKEKRQAVISHAVTKGLDSSVPMKDSGIDWMGSIPHHWEMKRLKYLGKAITGLTYSPTDIVDEENGTLVLRSSNVQKGQITLHDNVFVSAEIPENLVTRIGDILICSRNGSRALIGKNATIDSKSADLTFGAFMTVFRSEDSAYMSCIFNSPLFEFQSGAFMTSTINQLTLDVLNNFEIPFPPSDERKLIAEFLEIEKSKFNELIEEAFSAIETLKERRSALISAAVTGKIDVRGLVHVVEEEKLLETA